MKEPVEHIERAMLPWRTSEQGVTECGHDKGSRTLLTREQFEQKVRDQGKQRAAMSTCITCWDGASRHSRYSSGAVEAIDWQHNPASVMAREIRRTEADWPDPLKPPLLNLELHALAALIEAHREEFDEYLSGAQSSVSIETLRAQRRSKRFDHAGRIIHD